MRLAAGEDGCADALFIADCETHRRKRLKRRFDFENETAIQSGNDVADLTVAVVSNQICSWHLFAIQKRFRIHFQSHMRVNVLQAIIERRRYPVFGNSVESELRYATDILNTSSDKVLLVFPSAILNKSRSQTLFLRELIFGNWKVAGIFDVGKVFEPEASIDFSVLFVQRVEPNNVSFGVFNGRTFATHPRRSRQDGSLGEMPPISESYRQFITSIEQLIETGILPQAQNDFRFYQVDAMNFDDVQLNARFYDPDLTENEERIRSEKWVLLEEIADVLVPKPLNVPARLLTLKSFAYPFPEKLPLSDKSTNIILRQGDIVASATDIHQAFLVTISPGDDVRPSHHMYVIRPRSDIVTPYYLFLYLKSDTARKYAMRYEKGTVLRRISAETLRSFPIVLPALSTQKQSFQLFERLFLRKGDDPIAEINQFLFAPQRLPQKSIQREFILEVIDNLQQSKRELISKLLMADFDEVEKCLGVHAHKSCLILCGSILEVVLLDWLSEIEKRDYFTSSDDIKLAKVIERLRTLLGSAYLKADNIRRQRNLVHPKELLKTSTEINDAVCSVVINDLKDVLRQRGLNRA